MKKKIISMILIWLSLLSFIMPKEVIASSTVDALCEIDTSKKGSLLLNYSYDDYELDDTNVKIYKIASVQKDFQYQLSDDFSDYPININGITSDLEWNILENTINSYIVADGIKEFATYSINDNFLQIENLEVGLYFVKTEKIDKEDYSLIFDNFLLSVPNLGDDGYWAYDVSIYPKVESYIPKYEQVNYTVIKEWRDDKENRPDSVDIDIYKDGILVESHVLSNSNNFTYSFEAIDDGSEWSVLERNVPSGYSVSILEKDKNIIIINTDSDYVEDNPKTYDDIKIYLYLLIGTFVGIVLLVISLFLNIKRVE